MLLQTDHLGIPRFTNRNLMDLIYSGNIEKCHVVLCDPNDDIEQFNKQMEEQDLPKLQKYIPIDVDQKTFDGVCQSEWFMPDKYKNIVLSDYLLDKCHTREEKARVIDELAEYHRRDLRMLLRYMIYLVDFMRENNIVWGVGRGSSVSSYVLYLIGVHKIDSLKYNLDWREFLR
jgi:DNA polymerase III alpha subunit